MEALSKAESDISFAARKLEQAFKKKSEESVEKNGGAHMPNPVKLVRRLTALELAMTQLRKDCETISKKRTDVVARVVAQQNQNVENVENLLRETEDAQKNRRHASRRQSDADQSWVDLSKDLSKQSDLLKTVGDGN